MPDRLLRTTDIASMLGTSPEVAASILRDNGVFPIDLGVGRGRGRRWLESAVTRALGNMHEKAQPKSKQTSSVVIPKVSHLARMSAEQLLQLTSAPRVQ